MRVLIVDDSTYIRSRIRGILENNGFIVVGEAANGESAIDSILELEPDLITLDNILPDMTGIDVLKALAESKTSAKILMISAVGQASAIAEGLENGASDYVVKPFDDQELMRIIQKIIKH